MFCPKENNLRAYVPHFLPLLIKEENKKRLREALNSAS